MRRGSDKSRGAIYRWLKKHHRTIKAGFARTDAGWESVVETMISEGVRGRGGVTPTCSAVSKVWHRLCRDLEEQAAKARRPHRSRAQGAWSPPGRARIATQQPYPGESRPTRAPAVRPATTHTPMPNGKPDGLPQDLPDHVRENLAALRRQFAHVDRHIVHSADED